jgi:serine/threonine protein kinase
MSPTFLEQHEQAIAANAYDAYLARLKSTLRLGIGTWLLILVLDAFAAPMSTRAFVDFLVVRMIGVAYTGLALLVVERTKRPPYVLARIIDVSVFAVPGLALGFLCSWLAGLKSPYAHAHGVVHRDVKPSNLFVCDDGDVNEHVKLLDFGIAKLESDAHHLTTTETFVGTPRFAAPEMIAGRGASASADVYSLGAVAFFALTGEPPFDALSRSGILNAHLVQQAPRVEALRPSVPTEVADIIARALVKALQGRYPSAQTMANALRHALWRMRGEPLENGPLPDDVRPPPRPFAFDTETADGTARPAREFGSALDRPQEA